MRSLSRPVLICRNGLKKILYHRLTSELMKTEDIGLLRNILAKLSSISEFLSKFRLNIYSYLQTILFEPPFTHFPPSCRVIRDSP